MGSGAPLPGGIGIPLNQSHEPHLLSRIERLERMMRDLSAKLDDIRAVLFYIDARGNEIPNSPSSLTSEQFNLYQTIRKNALVWGPFKYTMTSYLPFAPTGLGSYPDNVVVKHGFSRYMAMDTGNRFYIADGTLDRVVLLDGFGNFFLKFGTSGSGSGELDSPAGIDYFDDKVYVCDSGNSRVMIFDYDGTFVTGHVDLTFAPARIAVAGSQTWFTTKALPNITTFRRWHQSALYTLGGSGTGDGQFSAATGLACDSSGNLAILDLMTGSRARVQRYDIDGTFLDVFIDKTYPSGDRPVDLAYGPNDRLFIATQKGVHEVDSVGNVVWKWDLSEGRGLIETVASVEVDSVGNVYLATFDGIYVLSPVAFV